MEAASIGTVYLIGEVVGALVFGRLSDQLGRRSLFMWTLAVYLVGTGLTALTPRGSGWIIYLFATRSCSPPRTGMAVVPGTVSQYVQLKSHCPVTVVPHDGKDQERDDNQS